MTIIVRGAWAKPPFVPEPTKKPKHVPAQLTDSISAWLKQIEFKLPFGRAAFEYGKTMREMERRARVEVGGVAAEMFCRWLRLAVYERRMQHANDQADARRDERAGAAVVEFIGSVFRDREYGLDCVDNERWAWIRHKGEVRRYKAQKARGCCGFHDEKVWCPIDGKYYLIGFNFGH